MQYWLMKSEPDVWSIDQQKKAGATSSRGQDGANVSSSSSSSGY